jgi:hypothetical protein
MTQSAFSSRSVISPAFRLVEAYKTAFRNIRIEWSRDKVSGCMFVASPNYPHLTMSFGG